MKRTRAAQAFEAAALRSIKDQMLNWASRFGICLFMDSNGYPDPHGRYECLVGAGAPAMLRGGGKHPFAGLSAALQRPAGWIFLQLGYDLKNELEPGLESRHPPRLGFATMKAFRPQIVAYILRDSSELVVEAPGRLAQRMLQEILDTKPATAPLPKLQFRTRLDRQTYLERLDALKRRIRDGDCYEINFCNEAFTQAPDLDPVSAFHALNALSPAPFAAFFRDDRRFMMGASPERFLCQRGMQLISQPIKGTARRGHTDEEDARLVEALRGSEKERAENVMITDLVRNDLAVVSEPGSVQVDGLFSIHSFPQVHQMISTVRGTLRSELNLADAIRHAFPMGSMTGAPKYRVMQLTDQYEAARRELYAGSVGYIDPEGNADLNVVIRSLFYEQQSGYLSYHTGGAITWDSDPQAEWAEMRLKAAAMERVFS